uniref:Iron complex outermembrane recepter protein n=1 Tax=Candidatus Kentrum sp. FW TaxID=2126338 RepID=A0A450TER4_9GAMM|nr:MAG: iron complex outermembrane recepter protein [Candidatus Kentron sp. FW]
MLEEVSVTAEKRLEKLQNVPASVTAFSSEAIIDSGIENTQDFINLTPNVTLDDSYTITNTFLTVRGFSQLNNADSPMAIVVDGIPQNNYKQLKQELFDIERIEVLRGPQGSGYGRNAIGGAINIITKGPTEKLGA